MSETTAKILKSAAYSAIAGALTVVGPYLLSLDLGVYGGIVGAALSFAVATIDKLRKEA